MTRSKSSTGASSIRPSSSRPALFTQTSKRPYSVSARAASASTSSLSPTSVGTPIARTPNSAHSASTMSSCWSERAASSSEAPRFAKACAVARPIPLEAPVTTTTLSFMSMAWSPESVGSLGRGGGRGRGTLPGKGGGVARRGAHQALRHLVVVGDGGLVAARERLQLGVGRVLGGEAELGERRLVRRHLLRHVL